MKYHNLDAELNAGKVTEEALKALWNAECYDSATPMQWLEKRLSILHSRAKEGKEIHIVSTKREQTICNEREFLAWCEESFRNAYKCFLEAYKAEMTNMETERSNQS